MSNLLSNQTRLPDQTCCYSEQNIQFFNRYIINNKIDIIINQSGLNNRVSAVCTEGRKGTNAKLISVIHNTPYSTLKSLPILNHLSKLYGFGGLVKILYRQVMKYYSKYNGKYQYNNSDAVILLSSAYINEYKDLYNIKSDNKLFAIPNPLTIEEVYEEAPKENIALYVGRLTNTKSVDRLLKVWKRIQNTKEGKLWKLYILGDGPTKSSLENLCDEENISNVEFTGTTNPIPYYKKAKIFCMTSKYEGLPMTLIECQYFGVVPIIMNSYAAAKDIIKTNYNGIVTDESLIEYEDALFSLITDSDQINRMSHNCILEMKKYNAEIIYESYEKIFYSR